MWPSTCSTRCVCMGHYGVGRGTGSGVTEAGRSLVWMRGVEKNAVGQQKPEDRML